MLKEKNGYIEGVNMEFKKATPILENTNMIRVIGDNGIATNYRIEPIKGYVLHDKIMDDNEYDDEGNVIRLIALGYRRSEASVTINYDFETNPREFYTVLETEVPENQIFGG